jgi:hypothetical protein
MGARCYFVQTSNDAKPLSRDAKTTSRDKHASQIANVHACSINRQEMSLLRLVQRRVGALPKLFDFILEEQFSSLEFDDAKIVGGQMRKGLVQFTLENAVFPFQFNEMRLNRHI